MNRHLVTLDDVTPIDVETLGIDMHAHPDAEVQVVINSRSCGLALDLPVAGTKELGALVERLGKGIQS